MKNILVVGGAGYIGGLVVNRLQALGWYDTYVYDGLLYEHLYRKPCQLIVGDIRNTEKLRPLVEAADAVIWLAALVGDKACEIDPDITHDINTNPLKWYSKHFPEKPIIFMSTCSVYGANDELLTEKSAVNPLSSYATSKLEAEHFVQECVGTIFRLGTLFGVGDRYSRLRLDLVLNYLTVRANQGLPITIHGGDQWRPLLHVGDVAKAIEKFLAKIFRDGAERAQVYNLNYQNYQIRELAQALQVYFDDLEVDYGDAQSVDPRNYKVLADKAAEDWGFNPMFDLQDGIIPLSKLIEEGRLQYPDNPLYHNHLQFSNYLHKIGYKGSRCSITTSSPKS